MGGVYVLEEGIYKFQWEWGTGRAEEVRYIAYLILQN